MHSTFSKFVVCILILAACSPADAIDTTTSSLTTTTLPTTTTTAVTTTTETPSESPINGLPVTDPALLNRRLLAVKIDNHPNARPHSGINHADVVFEIRVEGITRFLTMWMQSDAEFLGPMRSGRPTDATLLSALNQPTFAISGAQGWVQQLIRSNDINLLTETTPAAFRVSFRRAPHNLYVTTAGLRADADAREFQNLPPTGPIWEFGPMPADAATASAVHVDFRGTDVDWTWDATTGTWLRSVDGRESGWRDEDGTEGRIGFPVLIGLYSEQYSNNGLPSSHTTGSGQAFVFADGKVVAGTWERETETEWYTLTDADGNTIAVPPGQAWISLVPDSGGLTYE